MGNKKINYCKDCKYFRKDDNYGCCDKPNILDYFSSHSHTPYAAIVSPDFGCIFFEHKNKTK